MTIHYITKCPSLYALPWCLRKKSAGDSHKPVTDDVCVCLQAGNLVFLWKGLICIVNWAKFILIVGRDSAQWKSSQSVCSVSSSVNTVCTFKKLAIWLTRRNQTPECWQCGAGTGPGGTAESPIFYAPWGKRQSWLYISVKLIYLWIWIIYFLG